LLQQWYGLSDPGLEEALSDRLSFRRFVDLALADPVPDHSTLSRFRSELVRRGLDAALLAELNRQLDAKGLMVKTGIDRCEPGGRRQPPAAEGVSRSRAAAIAMRPGTRCRRSRCSATAHVAVDQGSGLVRQAILTPANVSDKTPFLDLVQGDEQAVYADKGYEGWWYRAELALRGIEDGIMRSAAHHVRLSALDQARNRAIGTIRAAVERVFATMKRWYGYGRVRYRSLARNALQLQLLAMAMNLRRGLVLSG